MSHSKSSGSIQSSQYNSYQNGGVYSSDSSMSCQNLNSQEFEDQKKAFFAKRQEQNAMRPDHVPPSQGGKYSGFGYTKDPQPKNQSQEILDSTLSSLASGWSMLSLGASKIASTAKEKAAVYGSLASSKVKDGSLLESVGSQVTSLASKVGDISKKGWSSLGGSNISSPQGGYSGFSDHHLNNSDSGYQRSTSSGKLSSPSENNEWNWNDDKINSNNQKSYQNSSGGDNGDDDWNGFDISGNIGGYQSSSYQIDDNKTQIKKI